METTYKHNTVLLVDDVDLDNFVSKTIIKAFNFSKNIHTVSSSTSALEFLKKLEDSPALQFPEVIFIDINMPATDGFQFIKNLKRDFEKELNTYKPKLVILTSSIFNSDRQKAKESFDDICFIVKPLTEQALNQI